MGLRDAPCWLAGAFVCFAASAGQAQPAALATLFGNINDSVPAPPPAMIAELMKDGFEQSHRAKPDICVPTSFSVSDVHPATADAAVQNGIAQGKVKNAWTANVAMTGCPLSDASYLVIRFNPDVGGRPAFREIIYSRGSTHAGFSVSRDAMQVALGAMAAALKSAPAVNVDAQCMANLVTGSREMVDDTKVGPDFFGVRYSGEWDERWHFQVCHHDVGVLVHFRADGSGGAYFDADPRKALVR